MVPDMRQSLDARLADWRRMTARMEQLKASGGLGEAEFEMIAVLKFSSNVLLREQVLLQARHILAPSEGLVNALLDVVCNRQLFVDERTLAAQALGFLVPRLDSEVGDEQAKSEMIRRLTQTLDLPEAEVFRQAVTRVIAGIRAGQR